MTCSLVAIASLLALWGFASYEVTAKYVEVTARGDYLIVGEGGGGDGTNHSSLPEMMRKFPPGLRSEFEERFHSEFNTDHEKAADYFEGRLDESKATDKEDEKHIEGEPLGFFLQWEKLSAGSVVPEIKDCTYALLKKNKAEEEDEKNIDTVAGCAAKCKQEAGCQVFSFKEEIGRVPARCCLHGESSECDTLSKHDKKAITSNNCLTVAKDTQYKSYKRVETPAADEWEKLSAGSVVPKIKRKYEDTEAGCAAKCKEWAECQVFSFKYVVNHGIQGKCRLHGKSSECDTQKCFTLTGMEPNEIRWYKRVETPEISSMMSSASTDAKSHAVKKASNAAKMLAATSALQKSPTAANQHLVRNLHTGAMEKATSPVHSMAEGALHKDQDDGFDHDTNRKTPKKAEATDEVKDRAPPEDQDEAVAVLEVETAEGIAGR